MLRNIVETWEVKTIVSAITGTLVMLCGPMQPFILALFILIIIDFITGLYRAILLKQFTSRGLRRGIGKLITYFLLLIVGYQLALLHPLLTWIHPALIAYLGLTEYESITENIAESGGIKLPSLRGLKIMWENIRG